MRTFSFEMSYFSDSFVKSRLVLDARRFAEWLMQVGLLRGQASGLCRAHNFGNTKSTPLQLRMYAEESKFPHRLIVFANWPKLFVNRNLN